MGVNVSSLCRLPDDRRPVIVAARRTPIGRAGRSLAGIGAESLLSPVVKALLSDAPLLDPGAICDVVVGNAAGGGGNVARLAALGAGLPVEVPGMTVDRQCGSGLEAVMIAARMVAAGAGDVYLAGGVESVSTAPWRVERPNGPGAMPRFFSRARFSPDDIGDPEMGEAAENVARAFGITRRRQDEFALRSHQRAIAARAEGRFEGEIVPVETGGGIVREDECPRPDTSMEALAKLRPAFAEDGTVTAGNSCPLNDGAALVLVVSRARARELGFSRMLGFVDAASAGVDPNLLGIGPVSSTRRLLERNPGLDLSGIGAIEFNEAFAAQVLASADALGIDPVRLNRHGGAIALGHPFGASGAVLVTRLFSQLVRSPDPDTPQGCLALAMLGIAGGLGLTALFERICEAS